MKAAIYVRAAAAPEQVNDRITDLRDCVDDRGWTVGAVHVDRAIGGTEGQEAATMPKFR